MGMLGGGMFAYGVDGEKDPQTIGDACAAITAP